MYLSALCLWVLILELHVTHLAPRILRWLLDFWKIFVPVNLGIATRYGLDGPVIESQWAARFSAPVQTGSEAHPASFTIGTGSLPGVKRPGLRVDYPPLSSAEVKEIELYLYSRSGPSWPLPG